jgi:hypothetical protein
VTNPVSTSPQAASSGLSSARNLTDGLGRVLAIPEAVRCSDCQREPLKPAHYCECCGRDLPLYESHAEQTSGANEKAEGPGAIDGADDWAPRPAVSDLRCRSCGGPSLDGNHCQACREASSIKPPAPAVPARNDAPVSAKVQPVQATVSSSPVTSTAPLWDHSDQPTVANTQPSHANLEATSQAAKNQAVAARAKAIADEVVRSHEAHRERAKSDSIPPDKIRRSPVVPRAAAPVRPPRRDPRLAVVVVGVLVAAISVGAAWLRIHNPSSSVLAEQIAPVVATDPVAEIADAGVPSLPTERAATATRATHDRDAVLPGERSQAPAPATQDRKPPATTSAKASTASQPKPMTPVRPPRRAAVPAVVSKPVRVQDSTSKASASPVLTSAPVAWPPVVRAVATAPPAAAPVPVVGPFFETKDVTESPRIATRAKPKLQGELKDRSINEVIVVRALVSQTGHPSRISLLRRSKTGPQLDDVVLEAVNQWTFAPARKKGEAVACWFNFAVQIGGAE